MPIYNDLRPASDHEDRDFALVFPSMSDAAKIRTIDRLLGLKAALDQHVPPRRTDENLLIASWNIKEFGHTTQRLPEAYFYMAEILARFDLVAVQEVKSSLKDLGILMRLLGRGWQFMVNDITDGTDGNSERSAYLFNTTRVRLGGLAGEIVLWDELTQGSVIKQLKRTPYITGFRSAWKAFAMIAVHLQPGDDDAQVAYRKEEVRLLLAALAHKLDSGNLWNANLVLVGDFNLYHEEDEDTIDLIEAAGYTQVTSLVGKDTNASQTQAYDRFFLRKSDYFEVVKTTVGAESGDVFDPFAHVYPLDDRLDYKADMQAVYGGSGDLDDPDTLVAYYKNHWRKNQLSDHFPIWFELATDSSVSFLEQKKDALES